MDPVNPPNPAEKREPPIASTPDGEVKRVRTGTQHPSPIRPVIPPPALTGPEPTGEPECDDPAFRDRMRSFEEIDAPTAEQHRRGLEAAVDVPVPMEDDDSGLLGHCQPSGEDNVHAAYSAHLCMENAAHRGYHPNFVLKNANAIPQAHKRRWKETCIEIATDWMEKDLDRLREASDFSDHFAYLC